MDKTAPCVSIGLPVYNGQKHISGAIESVLKQTFEDFELVISDNASTDDTEAVCRAFAARDSRIKYYRQEHNLGAVRNFNKVFELSRGEYFKWLGFDDWLEPEFLESCVSKLDTDSSLVLSYCHEKYYTVESEYICSLNQPHNVVSHKACKRFHQIMWCHSLIDPTYAVIRRSALEKTSLITNLLQADDILAVELSLLGRFGHIRRYLSYRRAQPKTAKERMDRIEPSPETIRLQFTRMCLEYWRIVKESRRLNIIEKILLLVDLVVYFTCVQIRRRILRKGGSRNCPRPLLEYLQTAVGPSAGGCGTNEHSGG